MRDNSACAVSSKGTEGSGHPATHQERSGFQVLDAGTWHAHRHCAGDNAGAGAEKI